MKSIIIIVLDNVLAIILGEKMNKKVLIATASTVLLSFGLITNTYGINEVSASVRVGRVNRLQHNAYFYNAQGHKIHKSICKQGKKIIVLGTKTIKGKVYAKVGKNHYIRISNFNKSNKNFKQTAKLRHNAYVFDEDGKRVKVAPLRKNKIITIKGIYYVKGKKYYRIGKNQFIKAVNVILKNTNSSKSNRHVTDNGSVMNKHQDNTSKTTTNLSDNNANDFITSNVMSSEPNNDNKSVDKENNKKVDNTGTSKKKANSDDSNVTSTKPSKGNKTNNDDNWDLAAARKQSVNTNDVTAEDKLLNTETIDGPYTATAEVLHNGFIYDDNGHHIPGQYISNHAWGNFRPQWTRLGYKVINGHKYYLIQYNKPKNYYVKYDVFAENGKDENPIPVTKSQLADAREFLDKAEYITKIFDDKYLLSYNSIRNNYDTSILALDQLLSQDKYSESDIKAFEANITEAANKLNGKRLIFHNPISKITEEERKEIINLVNSVEGSTDAGFLPGRDYTIMYTSPTFNIQMKEDISKYAAFMTRK